MLKIFLVHPLQESDFLNVFHMVFIALLYMDYIDLYFLLHHNNIKIIILHAK